MDNQSVKSKSHPGLYTLFFMEMWERMSYYGMRAMLILFMTTAGVEGGLGLKDETSGAVYGIYTGFVYLLALPGGWIADRLLGQQRAVWYGGCIIAAGHVTMAAPILIPGMDSVSFFAGLTLVAIGTGLLKPNVSAIVGGLYPDGGARRDAAFSIFYMGINLGAFMGPLVCGGLRTSLGWHYGFGAAGVGMIFGLIQYHFTKSKLEGIGTKPPHAGTPAQQKRQWTAVWASVGGLVLLGLFLAFGGFDIGSAATGIKTGANWVVTLVAVLFFASVFADKDLTSEEKDRVKVIVVLFVGAAIFWGGFEQAGTTLNLFADRYTIRDFSILAPLGLKDDLIPTEFFQSLNAIYIVIFAPFFAAMWINLARKNMEPSLPMKFAIAMFQLGLGFLVMVGASYFVVQSGEVMPTWLMFTYLFHTLAELCFSPVGLSAVTKLAPPKYASQMMGTWFLGTALGSLFAGGAAGYFATEFLAEFPMRYGVIVTIAVVAGIALVMLSRKVVKWMGGVS